MRRRPPDFYPDGGAACVKPFHACGPAFRARASRNVGFGLRRAVGAQQSAAQGYARSGVFGQQGRCGAVLFYRIGEFADSVEGLAGQKVRAPVGRS